MLNASLCPLLLAHFENVLFHRVRTGVLLLNPLQSCSQHRREGEIRVAGGVRRSVFDARGVFLAGLVLGDADEVGAVTARPGEVHRRFEAGDESFV